MGDCEIILDDLKFEVRELVMSEDSAVCGIGRIVEFVQAYLEVDISWYFEPILQNREFESILDDLASTAVRVWCCRGRVDDQTAVQ